MDAIVLVPLGFLLMVALVVLHSRVLSVLSPEAGSPAPRWATTSYACGEDVAEHSTQPGYRQFFPFAFFFTLMHVVALLVATVPRGSVSASVLAATFLSSAAIAVYVLFRR